MTQSHSAQQYLMLYEDERLTQFATQFYDLMRAYGYQHVQVPAIELSDLFLSRAGDQIIANLFTFDRFGKQLALRPEFTALAAHRYAKSFPKGNKTVRWYFNGSVFLEHFDQRDTSYQRMSVGAELFGLQERSYADAEILYAAAEGIFSVAALHDVHIAVGHIGILREILSQYQLDDRTERYLLDHMVALAQERMTPEEVINQFEQDMTYGKPDKGEDALSYNGLSTSVSVEQGTHRMLDVMLDANERGTTMGGRNRKDIVQRLVKKHQRFTLSDQVKEAVHHLHRWILTEGAIDETLPRLRTLLPKHSKTAEVQFEQWIATLEMIDKMGIDTTKLHIVPGLARNWTYYTGIVFEFTNSDGTYFGGGGRYDELVRLMGAEVDVPAIGFAYDVDAILQHMSSQQRARRSSPLLFALPSAYTDDILLWLREMRSANLPVTVVNQEEAPAEALCATENGGVRYKNRVYSTDEISDLIEAIKNA